MWALGIGLRSSDLTAGLDLLSHLASPSVSGGKGFEKGGSLTGTYTQAPHLVGGRLPLQLPALPTYPRHDPLSSTMASSLL